MAVQVAQASPASGVDLIEAARLTPAEVVARLGSSESGLTAAEAAARLGQFGHNAIRSHGARPFAILGRQLRNPLLILLAAATITSLIVGERTDAALVELGCVGYIWKCALTRHRDRLLTASLIVLAAQGVGLVIGRGNCPLGPLQRRLGDPVPLFELILPPRAAKAAVPALAIVALAGVIVLATRMPRKGP